MEIFFWPGRNALSSAGGVAGEHSAEGEITRRRRVKKRVHCLARARLQPRPQIRGGGKAFDRLRAAGSRPGRGFAEEQRDRVAARREEIGEFHAQPARGEIREPAHVVQRLKGGPGGDKAVHAVPD